MKNSKYNTDLTNLKFGNLIAVERIPTKNSNLYDNWKCLCDCGNIVTAYSYNLIHGHVHCCGPTHLNLIGIKFSNLTVIKRLENGTGNETRNWLCLCDCGNTLEASTSKLNKGLSHCGCKKDYKNHKFTKKINSNEEYLFKQYMGGATRRNLVFELDIKNFSKIIKLNCFYCGSPPFKKIQYGKNPACLYNGIDRLDNSIGYLLSNCVSCCTICNKAKLDLSLQNFISWGIRLSENLEKLFPEI
jgi:hypothetical protein